MKWYINSGERNCSKATFEFDIALGLLQVLSASEAGLDDVAKHLFNLFNGELLREL